MRALWLGLALAAMASGPASAACSCVCFDGRMRSQCTSPIDPPAICNRICPLPVNPPGSPPTVTGGSLPLGADGTLATGSPALLGSTGNSGR